MSLLLQLAALKRENKELRRRVAEVEKQRERWKERARAAEWGLRHGGLYSVARRVVE